MNKTVYQIMSSIVLFALTTGSYSSADASSATVLQAMVTYYASSSGNGINCTVEAPCSISTAISEVAAGDTIVLRGGVYPSFTLSKSDITITAYPNEIPVISGGIGIRLFNINHVVIHGLEVTNAGGNGVLRMGGIVILGGSNNTIENCKIHDNYTDSPNGIKIQNSSNNRVLHNEVYSNGGVDGGVGIRIIGSTSATVSAGNEIGWNITHDNIRAGSNADGIGLIDNVDKTYIHDNTAYGNGDDGIDTWNTTNNIVENNTAYGNVSGDGNGFKLGPGLGNIVTGNIAYENLSAGFTSNGAGVAYKNNLSYNNDVGFNDSWRTGNTEKSYFSFNTAYSNTRRNFYYSAYSVILEGNSEPAPTITPTATQTPTASTVPPTPTLTASPILPTNTPTASPVPPTLTASPIPPTATPTASLVPELPTATTQPAIQPTNTPQEVIPLASEKVIDDKDSGFVYSPGWQDVSNQKVYGGSYKQTTKNGSFATFAFTGQSLSILYTGGPAFRKIDVYVDGLLVGTINERGKSTFQKRWDYPGQLTLGSHTLKLIFVTGSTNNTTGSIDAVIVR